MKQAFFLQLHKRKTMKYFMLFTNKLINVKEVDLLTYIDMISVTLENNQRSSGAKTTFPRFNPIQWSF